MPTLFTRPSRLGSRTIRNVHERSVPGGMAASEELLHRVHQPGGVWPSDRWAPLMLDADLTPGSRGGHGAVRYEVAEATDRSVVFRFAPGVGLRGTHRFELVPLPEDQVLWRHVIDAEPEMAPALARAVITMHDALLEDLLDDVEARLTGRPLVRRTFPPIVRALHATYTVYERVNANEPKRRMPSRPVRRQPLGNTPA